jgi:hypothetical protein
MKAITLSPRSCKCSLLDKLHSLHSAFGCTYDSPTVTSYTSLSQQTDSAAHMTPHCNLLHFVIPTHRVLVKTRSFLLLKVPNCTLSSLGKPAIQFMYTYLSIKVLVSRRNRFKKEWETFTESVLLIKPRYPLPNTKLV